jgi:hypothetical protein
LLVGRSGCRFVVASSGANGVTKESFWETEHQCLTGSDEHKP